MRRTRKRLLGCLLCAAVAGSTAATVTTGPNGGSAHAAPAVPYISEIVASNTTGAFQPSDWIEITNPTGAAVNLQGWHLTDDAANLTKWTFANSRAVAGGTSIVVLADSSDSQTGQLATNFALSKGGEYLALVNPSGVVTDQFAPSFPAQYDNVSYGHGANGVVGFMQVPTPGAPNGVAVTSLPKLSKPSLSLGGGFRIPTGGSITVTAAGPPGTTLRYTTNGRLPTSSSPVFPGGGLTISTNTYLRVVATATGWLDSNETTATYLNVDQVLSTGTGTPAGWPADGAVNGQHFVYGLDQADVASNRAQVANALTALPTVSIVTDQANLTDPTTGIYVNAVQSGSAWERSASVEYIDGANSFQIASGLRIRGGTSRLPQFAQHAMSLRFTSSYDGALQTPQALFPDGITTFASLDLRSENNVSWQFGSDRSTFLREIWTRDTQLAAGQRGLHSKWVQVFLNGQFWGVYMLIERMTQTQAAATWGGDPASYNVLKPADDRTYEADAGNDADWRRLWDLTADQVVTDAEYAEIAATIDVRSLAGSQVIQAHSVNLDYTPSPGLDDLRGNNWIAVGGPGHPYQFLITDAEFSLGSFDHDVTRERLGPFPVLGANPEYRLANFNPGWLHSALLSNSQYRVVFAQSVDQLVADNGVLGAAASAQRWTSRKAQVEPFVWSEAARWGHSAPGGPYSYDDWWTETVWVEANWFPARTPIFRTQARVFLLGMVFGTAGSTASAARRLADQHPQA